MIIVSQDKNKIINFDNIVHIFISGNSISYGVMSGTSATDLGTYATEERAQEVLQEIVTLFKDKEILHIRKSTLNNLDEISEPKYILKPVCRAKVYEMPKE